MFPDVSAPPLGVSGGPRGWSELRAKRLFVPRPHIANSKAEVGGTDFS
jgi:hypothetical protein